jgi:two-component system response regulator AtoC
MERVVALMSFEQLTVEDVPERIRSYTAPQVLPKVADVSEMVTLEEVARRYIHRVLEAVGGSRTLAARILGVDRKTLYRKLHSGGDEEEPRT